MTDEQDISQLANSSESKVSPFFHFWLFPIRISQSPNCISFKVFVVSDLPSSAYLSLLQLKNRVMFFNFWFFIYKPLNLGFFLGLTSYLVSGKLRNKYWNYKSCIWFDFWRNLKSSTDLNSAGQLRLRLIEDSDLGWNACLNLNWWWIFPFWSIGFCELLFGCCT